MLPNNYLLCKARLNSLLKRLRGNPELFEQYDNIIKEQEMEGIVESVEGKICKIGTVHYIPHREVVRPDKDRKVRIVYDASAKLKGKPSLNDCLHMGPCMLPNIFGIMVRFQTFQVCAH